MQDYELTYGDLNPQILYAHKRKTEEEGVYHCHDFAELTYILSGSCKYLVEGKEYLLGPGDLLVANAGLHHQFIMMNPKEPPVEFYTGFRDFHFRNMPQDVLVLPDGGPVMRCKGELRQELNRLCYAMHAEHMGNKSGKYFMLKAYLTQLLILLVRENSKDEETDFSGCIFTSSNRSYVVKKIISYLNENYNKKISLDQIAHNMYLSPVYISKLFKEETGESPINYLIKIRLEKAKQILEVPDSGSVKSVAKAVGYEDVYYFSKLFKKYYGMAPLYYKKSL